MTYTPQHTAMAETRPRLRGLAVLLVEDHRDTLDLLAEVLRMCEAEVRPAGNARDALELFKTKRCDVVVTDLGLPEDDGVWLLDQVRASERPHTPVIAMTGLMLNSSLARRFDGVDIKPCDPFELCRLVLAAAAA
jgi:CheY-like chemotaxis protein